MTLSLILLLIFNLYHQCKTYIINVFVFIINMKLVLINVFALLDISLDNSITAVNNAMVTNKNVSRI